jgi:hypothetical protein
VCNFLLCYTVTAAPPTHLQVTELKGNVRVLARIRPMSEKEHSSSGSEAAVRVINEDTVSVAGTSVREYEFDRVFGPSDGQAQVCHACARCWRTCCLMPTCMRVAIGTETCINPASRLPNLVFMAVALLNSSHCSMPLPVATASCLFQQSPQHAPSSSHCIVCICWLYDTLTCALAFAGV